MKFNTDKITWTDAMKHDITEHATILDRIVDNIDDIEVKLFKLNDDDVKIVLTYCDYRVQAVGPDFYSVSYDALYKLKSVISKNLKKQASKAKNRTSIADSIVDNYDPSIFDFSKEKILFVPSESADEAVEQFEKTDYGFYVFKDIDQSNMVSIIYRRYDGTFGVIRCK